MAMGPERSKQLHNFSFPCLKWGTQRLLRCVNNNTDDSPSSFNHHHRSSKFNPPHIINQNDNLPKRKNDETIDDKIMEDLTVAAKKLKVSIFTDEQVADASASNATIRPWNLRTRRAACKAPPPPPPPPIPAREEGRRFFDIGSSSPSPVYEKKKKKMMMVMMNERIKFSVSLSKEEVEHDFWALVGTRPPRRPKKRPRIVQRKLDTLHPGKWLGEVTAESYKVSDVPE